MIKHLGLLFKNKAARAIGIVFALCGLGFGTWASLIPFVKDKFSLDEAQLGLLLLALPLGNFIANPLTVIFIRRWGIVKVALIAGTMTSFFFALPFLVNSILLTALGLFLAGSSFGFTNVAMNTCASAIEENSKLHIMSSCHGMWSIGAMCGALFSGLIIVPLSHFFPILIEPQILYALMVAIFILLVTLWIRHDLDQVKGYHIKSEESPKLNWKTFRPNKTLWILISICLCTFLTEGTIADWSGVYLREINLAPLAIAGFGFAVYSFFMATGRFVGDELIARFGAMRVLRAGGILVFIGFVMVIISQGPWASISGFMLIGMGISLASPILYGAAAKLPGLVQGAGLATLNTFAMASFFGGPVLIGFIGKITNLRIAFMLVALAAVVWIIQTTRVIVRA
jgi:MFS family permease